MTELIAAIHHISEEASLRDVETAKTAGCHGVALISMIGDWLGTLKIAEKARQFDIRLGINLLGVAENTAMTEAEKLKLDFVWSDGMPGMDGRILRNRLPLYVGVAFKYQPEEKMWPNIASVERTINRAVVFGWLPTTSGSATGIAPDERKLFHLKELCGDHPLAVASGIAVDNAEMIKKYCATAFVNSSISRADESLDPVKTKELVDALR